MKPRREHSRGAALWAGIVVVAALLAVAAVLIVQRADTTAGTAAAASVRVDPGPQDPVDFGSVGEFRFTDQLGRPYGSAELAGSAWALAAIFTTCAGPCPKLVQALDDVRAELADTDVRFVCVTVDPAHDSPGVLRAYAEERGIDAERWRFLTGPQEELFELLRSGFHLGVGRDDEAPDGFHVTHATQVVAVDRAGKIRGWYSGLEPAGNEALAARLRFLAAEEAPELE